MNAIEELRYWKKWALEYATMYIESSDDGDKLRAERDEAREWARKYKRMYEEATDKLDGCYKKQKWYAELCDDLMAGERVRKPINASATIKPSSRFEHGVYASDGEFIPYDTYFRRTCTECGKEL